MLTCDTEFVEALVRSVPNSDKEAIAILCENLTHFDPAHYLPNELMFSVLSYLSPKDLLTSSTISRPWRDRAQDEKLWRCSFAREGWVMDPAKMREFEELAKGRGKSGMQAMTRKAGGGELERRGSKKRKTEEAFSDGEGVPLPGSFSSTFSPITDGTSDGMEGVASTASAYGANGSIDARSRPSSSDSATSLHSPAQHPPSPSDLKISPPMWRPGSVQAGEPKLSWPWLYKQRTRLEKNWEDGKFRMFSLPHPRHPEESHEECVYTIQHNSRHLVSGSRDKTIRKWDLNTYRLIGAPLKGHTMSVLCLQFDERPEHDIIVSGGSDSLVIIWQFSTGKILKKMSGAHYESVLNLRFDDRYIVTCSKDKTIKVWNRRALRKDDPAVPQHTLSTTLGRESLTNRDMIREYSLLADLHGHQAAVNAVMIHDNTIISASGDRTIKSWNISRARLNKTYVGHTKGIACVQFDGRRIVSGSSDNTVRIFDAENQAEIGCLAEHSNLVRTVQARFGDLDIVTDEELEDEARKADRDFFRALEAGMQPASAARRGVRNAGSSRPEDMLSVGTKVPPGGGGSRWAKIVSGSYDETVILWKRDRNGKWVKKQQLHQDMLLKNRSAAGLPAPRRHVHANALPLPVNIGNIQVPQQQQGGGVAGGAQQIAVVQPAQANAALWHQAGMGTQAQSVGVQAPPAHQTHVATTTTVNGAGNGGAVPPQQQQLQMQPLQHQHQNSQAILAALAAQASQQQVQTQPQPQPLTAQQAAVQAQRQHNSDSNRVFKLQFDARRLICCSQNKVIVGWDFANGERALEMVGGWCVETS